MAAEQAEPSVDPRLLRLRVELFTAAQTLKGDDLKYFHELVHDVAQICDVVPLVNDALKQATEAEAKPMSMFDLEAATQRDLLSAARSTAQGNKPEAAQFVDAYLRLKRG